MSILKTMLLQALAFSLGDCLVIRGVLCNCYPDVAQAELARFRRRLS